MQHHPKKIVIIGPESTGKSTLTKQLATYFKSNFCDEYARNYLCANGTKYTYADLLIIAKGQIHNEDTAVQIAVKNQLPFTFIDTDMQVMKVWCEYVFNQCHTYILEQIATRTYDLYLLCNTDLPWVSDGLREYPDEKVRQTLYAIYKDILVQQAIPFVEIKGQKAERLATAIAAVAAL